MRGIEKYFCEYPLDRLMKTMTRIVPLGAVCLAITLQAATLNEWNFYSDPAGKTLSQSVNSAGAAVFAVGNEAGLSTDGLGNLICTQNDPGTTGMWTNGAILDATLSSPVTTGVQFLRYDFSYDLSSTSNDSGCVASFAFYDGTSNEVAGVILEYDVGANTNPTYQVIELTEITNTIGTVAVVAKIDLSSQTLSVWYDLTGDVSGFSESSPATNVAVSLSSFDSLRFQATGDIQPAGSTDGVSVGLLRTADSFADAVLAAPVAPAAKYSNEWTFERDVDGRSLAETINSGTNSPLAQFGAGYGDTVFTTNRALRCVGEDSGTDGVWTNGAVLDAALTSITSGVHYLRYDVAYDFSSPSNNSGTVLGVYFTGDSGAKVAGLVMGYDTGNLTNSIPVSCTLTPIPGATNIAKIGTLSAIAEVNLDSDTLQIWYDLSGSNVFVQGSPAFSTNITMTAIDNLRFHATGDVRPSGSSNFAEVDNIRMSGSWLEIIEAPADLTAPPLLSLTVTNSLDGAMGLGETNLVTVVISNASGAGAATQVTSALSNDLSSTAFTIVSNNTPPVALAAGESVTNTYELIAQERGNYTIYVSALSAETNTAPATFSLAAGANLTILSPEISEPGGSYSGLYEPGETLNITITTTNDGAKAVSSIVNTLTAASAGFTINPASDNYSSLAVGAATSTVYTVEIGDGVAAGTYIFNITNSAGSLVWTNSFDIEVFIRVPNTDWIKNNNTNNLNLGSSWLGGAVPNNTDRAILDPTVTAPITTDLGGDLSWRGIALVSNTSPWTITGTNTLTLGAASIDMSQAQADLTIASQLAMATTQSWNVATSRTLTVSGAITGSNSVPLVKTGAGTLVINNVINNFRGNVTVSNGTLSVANDNVLGGGTVMLDGGAMGATTTASLTNNVVLTGAAAFNNANELTLSGTVSGFGSLTKTGAGTLILNSDNTYSGGTTNNGTIEANKTTALGSGDVIMNTGSVLQAAPAKFGLSSTGIGNKIVLNGDATIKTKTETATDLINIDGPISGTGKLKLDGYQIVLRGNNSFSGGLLLSHNSYLRFYNINAFGTGPISMDRTVIILPYVSGMIANDITLTQTLGVYLNNRSIELSGQISGAGKLQVHYAAGTITLSGNNAGWTGGFTYFRRANLVVAHTNALGTGPIPFDGDLPVTVRSTVDLSGGNGLVNAMQFGEIVNGTTLEFYPIEFNLSKDMKISGQITDGSSPNTQGLLKTGSANLILCADNTYSGPTKVTAGSLTVNGSLASPDTTVFSGSTFAGTGTVQAVTMAGGSTLDLSAGGMTLNGNLMQSGSVSTTLGVPNASSAIKGTGGTLTLKGSLLLDFTGNAGAVIGQTFTVLSGWGTLTDNGTVVGVTGLSPFLTLDSSNLFVDGTVTVVASELNKPSLALDVPAGTVLSGTVVLTNGTGTVRNFTTSDNGNWSAEYTVAYGRSSFRTLGGTTVELKFPSNTNQVATRGVSGPLNIGFSFPFYGSVYTNFYVTADGAIGLINSTSEIPSQSEDRSGALIGGSPVIAPFWSGLSSTSGTIRYQATSGSLLVSFQGVNQAVGAGSGTNLQFQAELYPDGKVEMRYKSISGTRTNSAGFGIQSGDLFTTLKTPYSGLSAVLTRNEDRWVSWPPSGSVPANSASTFAVTADATDQQAGTSITFDLWFNWGSGSNAVTVLANVIEPAPVYSALSLISITGAAGQQVSAPFFITNSGAGTLTFQISSDTAAAAGLAQTNLPSSATNWINLPSAATTVTLLDPSPSAYITPENEGYSAMVPMGFNFPFYGGNFSRLSIGANGTLRFDEAARVPGPGGMGSTGPTIPARLITPYWGDLALDSNATIRYYTTSDQRMVVSWENVQQYGLGGGSNLSFQAVLGSDGSVQFNYRLLEGFRWHRTQGGIRGDTNNFMTVDLIQPGDFWTVTNVLGRVSTQYVAAVSNRAVRFESAQIEVIRFEPGTGSILPGERAEIIITGDASGVSAGSSTAVTNVSLSIAHNAPASPASLAVTFTVTNAATTAMASEPVLDPQTMDSDGDGIPDDQERIAGTDPQSADSLFRPTVSFSGDGTVLTWAAPLDGIARVYNIFYTTDLTGDWIWLATVTDRTVYVDSRKPVPPQMYYSMTVE